jgi:hypothetical protein
MPEGSAKNKLQRALVQAKKISDDSKPEKGSAEATNKNIAELVAELKKKSKTYVFGYRAAAAKASDTTAAFVGDSDDSDTPHNNADEKAFTQRMMASSSLNQKAARTMKMLVSNCLRNSFLFWKGSPQYHDVLHLVLSTQIPEHIGRKTGEASHTHPPTHPSIRPPIHIYAPPPLPF